MDERGFVKTREGTAMINFSEVRTIFVGGAATFSAVACRSISGTVVQETAKAIKFQMTDRRGTVAIWLPKSAIVGKPATYETLYNLAGWFRPDAYQSRMIERFEVFSGISAA
jgi:hypothetical protein